jgi:hypothetical protein
LIDARRIFISTSVTGVHMASIDDGTLESGWQRVQDFIFARELAEVYLLLDYLSGRSDKSLTAAIGDGKPEDGRLWIEEICKIGWPPKGSFVEQGAQAATLLLAKDRLNAVAQPANGASIVFTLMVAGDDEAPLDKSHRSRRRDRWWSRRWFSRSSDNSPAPQSASPSPNPPANSNLGVSANSGPFYTATDPAPTPPQGGGGGGNGGGSTPGGILGGYPPSRISLARLAYPGLIASARHFRWRINALLALLFICLILTCLLSWHIAAGRAMLARLDAIETVRSAVQKRITDAQVGSPAPGSTQTTAASGAPKPLVQRYCERVSHLSPTGAKIDQFEDATQLQICDQLAENQINYRNAREDIADWLAPWEWLKWAAHKICGGPRCLNDEAVALPIDTVNQQQWAVVVADVLATAVLPLCYGFLGAGAAVVRNIWGKMRDSLLSPRDLTLSLGQLALGAVIGACIGLFITPAGVGTQGASGLVSSSALTPSALSFIAGFGVEGVFVALESLVKRVFNIPDPKA